MADETTNTNTTPVSIANVKNAVNSILSANFDAKSQPCLLTCIKLVDNLLTKPNNPVFRTIKLSNPSIQSKIVECKGGVDLLRAMGFCDTASSGTNPSLQLSFSATTTLEFLRTVRQLIAQRCVQELGVDSNKIPPTPALVALAPAPATTTTTFNPYARQRFNAASQQITSNQPYVSTTEAELEKLQRQQAALERRLAQQPLDRAWRATRPGMPPPPTAQAPNKSTSITTETGSDASLLAARAAAQQRNLTTEQPLTTRAMRTVKALQNKKVYAQCVLNICFPDGGVVLMGTFRPQDTIASVVTAIQTECCRCAGAEQLLPQMELYVTPPRRVLRGTLQDEGLVPAAKVFVRYLTPTNSSAVAMLRPELFADGRTTTTAVTATTAFPQSHPLVQPPSASTSTANKPKPQKKKVVSKEEALLKRMMGKK